LNEEKAVEKRDEIKKGYDELKKEMAEFTGTCWMTEVSVGYHLTLVTRLLFLLEIINLCR